MEMTFWGVRGSVPAPGPETTRYGGNTSCVELRNQKGDLFIVDCGTGVINLGRKLIAGDFGKYDEHAVKQMNRNIALVRYRRYADLLLLEQLTATSTKASSAPNNGVVAQPGGNVSKKYKTITAQMAEAPAHVISLYEAVSAHLEAAGDDVQVKTTDFYVAFRRLRNFACVELRNQLGKLLVFVRLDPDTVNLEEGFARDMRGIGHFGTGDLEISIGSLADVEKAKPLFDAAYQNA